MQVKFVKVGQLSPIESGVVFSTDCQDSGITVVTPDNRVIFGYERVSHLPDEVEVEVLELDSSCDPRKIMLGMYAAGRLATFNWKEVCDMNPEAVGFGHLVWHDDAIQKYADSIQNVKRAANKPLF